MVESRRDRMRAATMREITDAARRILVEQGRDAVTLRAIARDIGMTAPALYRYFDSHQELLRHLVGDIFTELSDTIRARTTAVPGLDLSARFMAAAREFRRWALAHEREYELVFGTPLPGLEADQDDFVAERGRQFGWTFLSLFIELWQKSPFPILADKDIDPGLREQLAAYRYGLGVNLPLGTLLMFLSSWIRLQGTVSLETFGHLSFALEDPAPFFELMLEEMAPTLGLKYAPPDEDVTGP